MNRLQASTTTRCAFHSPLPARCDAARCPPRPQPPPAAVATRRSWLAAAGATAAAAAVPLAPLLQAAWPSPALADGLPGIEVVADEPGSGTAAARPGDLVLLHYEGALAGDGSLFDSTRGGQMYLDGGKGALRPVAIRLGGAPVPGVCEGLQRGVEGMVVGGRRTFLVPAALGFGGSTVRGPYGIVPGGSTLRYEVELLRLSRQGPDALMTGIAQCGAGAVNERTAGCADIKPAEFV